MSCFDEDFQDKIIFEAYDFVTNRMPERTQISTIHKLVERLWDDAKLDHTLKTLYAGPSVTPRSWISRENVARSVQAMQHPLEPVVDIDISHVEAVCNYNSFSPWRVTPVRYHSDLDLMNIGNMDSTEIAKSDGALLYDLASFFNHACQSNAQWCTFGDAIVVRAICHIKEGEEVTVSYCNAMQHAAARVKGLSKWGFNCQCDLCLADAKDGDAAIAERASVDILRQENLDVDGNIFNVKLKTKVLEETYSRSSTCDSTFVLKPQLIRAHLLLSSLCMEKATKVAEASLDSHLLYVNLCASIKERMAAMEMGGLIIIDKSISGSVIKPTIEQQDYLPVDVEKSRIFDQVEVTVDSLRLAAMFLNCLGDSKRGSAWLNVALWRRSKSYILVDTITHNHLHSQFVVSSSAVIKSYLK